MKALMLLTNAGKGVKIVIDGKWVYSSLENVEKLLSKKIKGLEFSNNFKEKI